MYYKDRDDTDLYLKGMSFSPSLIYKRKRKLRVNLVGRKQNSGKKLIRKILKECYLSDIDFISLIIIGSNDLNPYVILENNLK